MEKVTLEESLPKNSLSMEFLKYGRVPVSIAEELIEKYQEERRVGQNRS